jgi:hypothetical protein
MNTFHPGISLRRRGLGQDDGGIPVCRGAKHSGPVTLGLDDHT